MIIENVRGHGVEHVPNLLLEQVVVDHGAVSGLFKGEVAPMAGEVECLGQFFVLVMEVVSRQDSWWFWWWGWRRRWEEC